MQSAVTPRQIFRFGLFEADVTSNTLTRSGVRVKIQDQPFRVLVILLERPAEIVTREELRQKLWPEGTFVDFEGSLNVILKKLRAAIDDDSENPRFVETVPRRGYRFIAPVSVDTGSLQLAVPKSVADQVAATTPSQRFETTRAAQRWFPPRNYVAAAFVLLAAIGVAWLSVHRKQSVGVPLQASAKVSLRKSAAVLGFHNLSGRPDDAWLSAALSEMLSTELAGGEKLRLVSGEEVANLRLASPWPQVDTLDPATTSRIGTALNSDLLILGSYTAMEKPEHGNLRLDMRVQDARTGEILMETAQTGDRQNLFQLVSALGAKLRKRLGVPPLEEPDRANVMASLPSNPEAARPYALGVEKLREFDALAAKDLLKRVCDIEPKFALAHAMLARAWSQLGYEQKRKEEAKKALDLSAGLSAADRLQIEGDYYESLGDHEKAASPYRALFELFPDDVDHGLQLAAAENVAGHANQASPTLAQLRRLPPPASDDPRIDLLDVRAGATNDLARLALIQSAERKATAQGKKLIYAQARKEECENLNYSNHPNDAPAACEEAYTIFMAVGNRLMAADAVRMLGDYAGGRGHLEQAIATYQRALKILQELGEHYKTGAVLNNMAIAYENEGNLDRAESLYREAKSHFEQAGDKRITATTVVNIADILFLRGNLPGAAKLYQQSIDLETSADHGNAGYPWFRLADLKLAQGQVSEAHRLAQQGVDAYRENQGAYGYLAEALEELGAVLMAEGKLDEAQQQFQAAHEIEQKLGANGLAQESQALLAELALRAGHADQAESLIRPAIAAFEQEKSDPASASAYTVLSHALLMQGKVDEARRAVEQANKFSRTSRDPALRLPADIQTARVEAARENATGHADLTGAIQRLRSVISAARKLGYYQIECEAHIALAELETKVNPALGRSQLTALASETRSKGLELLAHQAEQVLTAAGTVALTNQPPR